MSNKISIYNEIYMQGVMCGDAMMMRLPAMPGMPGMWQRARRSALSINYYYYFVETMVIIYQTK